MLTLWIFNKVHSMSLQKPFLVKWKLILSDSLYSESRVTRYIKSYFFYPFKYLFVAIDYGAFRRLFHFCVITICIISYLYWFVRKWLIYLTFIFVDPNIPIDYTSLPSSNSNSRLWDKTGCRIRCKKYS